MNKGMYSSATDEWETPKELFSKLDAVYHFELDVCATKKMRNAPDILHGSRTRWSKNGRACAG